ncbi:MAG: GTPase ObgE [Anaerolineae bacterium]|nr:GTPase ObgE [Anaerolineae bacterium]
MIDEAKIQVRSGDGGAGIVHFHREKFVTRGGPDGGDGGKGGDVIFIAVPNLNTLVDFTHLKQFSAQNGKPGGPNNMTGADGADVRIKVPLGTVIKDEKTGAVVADLTVPNQEVVVLKGGRGGRGNPHWKNASRQTPRIAEKGFPGQEKSLILELKLIADIGIVGVPNAGKSTLLSVVSNAKPKIAAYPFTTLEPNLGVVEVGDRRMVVADIPGLVEGAHMGVGLGHSFLRHVQRTRVLIHLLDGSSENPLADFNQINAELALFDEKLAQKPQIVALNKLDLPEAQEHWKRVQRELSKRGYEVMSISGVTHQGTRELMNRAAALLATAPEPESFAPTEPLYELDETKMAYTITRQSNGSYLVRGENIERAARTTYWEFDEAVARFQRILVATGIAKALEDAGVKTGDTVFIGDYELEWSD